MTSLRGHSLSAVKNDTGLRAMCGPTAVAAITGKPLSRVRLALPRIRADGGMSKAEIADTMRALGIRGSWHNLPHRPTLASWFRARLPEQEAFPCVLHFEGHFATASGDAFLDTKTGLAPVHANDVPEPERVVQAIFLASSRGRSKPAPRTAPKVMRPNPASEFRKAVRAAGAIYEIERRETSYSASLSIAFADGRLLYLRHLPGQWTDDLDTLNLFLTAPNSPRFTHTANGTFAED